MLLEPQDFLLIALGAVVGTFGTVVGAGGGFLLVPALLLIYPDRKPETISAMSLLVVWANSVSGSIAYARMKRTDYRSGLWFAAGTLPGAIGGAFVVGFIPRRTFDAMFATFLILIAVYLITRGLSTAIQPPVAGRGIVERELRDRHGNRFIYRFQLWKGVIFSTFIGFISSLLGIGGGVIQVPVLTTVLHFPVYVATATTQFVLAFMAGEGTIVHFFEGTLSWDKTLGQAGLIALGAVPGAQVGAWLAQKLKGAVIIKALAASLILVGARLGLKAIQG